MDSMRSLNRSLPSSQSNKSGPPEQLLQAFKQAALSVTNLYKSAAADQESSRQAGYQDALDDLLKFLDRENIGIQDGEGWTIREWITARYDGGTSHQQSDSEDEIAPTENRQRSSSPTQDTRAEEANLPNSANQEHKLDNQEYQDHSEPSEKHTVFHFRAGDRNSDNAMQTDEPRQHQDLDSTTDSMSTPIRVEMKSRNHKVGQRNNNRAGLKSAHRAGNLNLASKRKLPFPDISEIFNVGLDKKDGGESAGGGGSNKRGRFV